MNPQELRERFSEGGSGLIGGEPSEISPYEGDGMVYSQKKGWVKESEFRSFVNTPRFSRGINSDGFLSVSFAKPAYECVCGFSGLFKSNKCARCGCELG